MSSLQNLIQLFSVHLQKLTIKIKGIKTTSRGLESFLATYYLRSPDGAPYALSVYETPIQIKHQYWPFVKKSSIKRVCLLDKSFSIEFVQAPYTGRQAAQLALAEYLEVPYTKLTTSIMADALTR